jgi:hypothetical protein
MPFEIEQTSHTHEGRFLPLNQLSRSTYASYNRQLLYSTFSKELVSARIGSGNSPEFPFHFKLFLQICTATRIPKIMILPAEFKDPEGSVSAGRGAVLIAC